MIKILLIGILFFEREIFINGSSAFEAPQTSFSVKANLGSGASSSINWQPCSCYCISIEKDFASPP